LPLEGFPTTMCPRIGRPLSSQPAGAHTGLRPVDRLARDVLHRSRAAPAFAKTDAMESIGETLASPTGSGLSAA
jgi:hypothetical protein